MQDIEKMIELIKKECPELYLKMVYDNDFWDKYFSGEYSNLK